MPAPPDNEVGPTPARQPARLSLNLTAMIDVVFLLLIYFLVATDFKLGEEIYRLDLPRRSLRADPFELPRDPLRIAVASTGSGAGYLIRVEGAAAQPASFQELFEFLAQNQQSAAAVGGLFEPDHPIIIEPGPATRWEHAIEAFNAAVRARYSNVKFGGG